MNKDMAYKNYRDLKIWQRSVNLSKDIYDLTRSFPREEMFALGDQMRRAAVSVASNIAEGFGRESNSAFTQFLQYSLGSLCELDTQLEIAYMQSYISETQRNHSQNDIEEIRKMIYAFRKSLKTEH